MRLMKYDGMMTIRGRRWEDPACGEPFIWGRVSVEAPLRLAIIERIRSRLPVTFVPPVMQGTRR